MEPFRIEVGEQVLEDLRERLGRTRWPDPAPDGGWEYGSRLAYVQELCEAWGTSFDWRAVEARLNEWPQYLTEIDGQRIHFIWVRSPAPDALPLLLTHGWPGSVVEFLDVIEPLRERFDLVIPSLPGYGWSGPTTAPGWDTERVARAWRELMAQLGYERYGAQGGDWGAVVSARLALIDRDRMTGLHLNMAPAPRAADAPVTAAEEAALADVRRFRDEGSAYQAIQSRNPLTLAFGLADSPAGLAGWIAEKYREWTDNDGDPRDALSFDQQLANLTVYWVTETIGSSVRLYRETRHAGLTSWPPARVEVPTAIADFPREIVRMPRSWVEAAYDVRRYTEMPRGGHFAAWEEPELFVEDVRAFFADHR